MFTKNASQIEIDETTEEVSVAAARTRVPTEKPKPRPASKSLNANQLAKNLYFYQAIVRAVYDGDTMTVDIDLGMNNWIHGEKLRLLRINAPEMKGREHARGEPARDFLRSLVDGKPIVIETYKDDKEKYGRYLAEVWVQNEKEKWINVNDEMVKNGHAQYHQY